MKPVFRLMPIFIAAAMHAGATAAAFDTETGLPRYDHADPVALNEHALQNIRAGDIGTAAIQLERAAQLAPHDARIRQNRDTLRAWQTGKPVLAQPTEASPAASGDTALPPFPLWPKK